MTEEQIAQYALSPEKILDPQTCNTVSAFLNGHISDLTEEEFEKRLVASQMKVKLLNDPGMTNAMARANWEVSEDYITWQKTVKKLRQYKAFRGDIKDRFQVLTGQQRRY